MKATKATKQNRKKAFTLVELVIVIAVIAILAAVLIPTFSSVINSTKNSADQQLVTNLNEIAATQQPFSNNNEFELADNIRKVLDEEGGYGKDRLVTKNSDAIIVYDTQSQKFERVKLNERSDGLVAFAEEDSADPYYLEEIFAGQIIISTGGNTLAEAIYNLHNLPNDVTGNYVAENYNKIPNDLKDTVKTILENSIMVTANGKAVAITFNGDTPSVGQVTQRKAKIIFSEEATTVDLEVAANNMPEKVIIPNNITKVEGNLANTQVAGNTTVVVGETAGNCTIQQARGLDEIDDTPDINIPPVDEAPCENGHDWDTENIEWSWTGYESATATFTCKNSAEHKKSISATITHETTEATCEEGGETVYTATVELDGVNYTDTKTVEIGSLGHQYVGEWTSDGEGNHYHKCERFEVCGNTSDSEECELERKDSGKDDVHSVYCTKCDYVDVEEHETDGEYGSCTKCEYMPSYSVTLNNKNQEYGTVAVDCGNTVKGGTEITVTITPNAGYNIYQFKINGSTVTAQKQDYRYIYKFTLAEDTTIEVSFIEEGVSVWALVTSEDLADLDGKTILFVVDTTDKIIVSGTYNSSNYLDTVTDLTLDNDGTFKTTKDNAILPWKVTKTDKGYAFTDSDGRYLGVGSNTSLARSTTVSNWTIEIDATNKTTVQNTTTTTRALFYQAGSSNRFANYATSNMTANGYSAIKLYMLVAGAIGDGTTDPTEPDPTEPEVPSGSYTLVTSVDQLSIGAKIIIVSGTKAMSTTQNNNNRGATDVTITNNSITPGSDVQVITLEEGYTSGTYALSVGDGKYLSASGSGTNNYLTSPTSKASTNASWKITISASSTTITASSSNRNDLEYNSQNSIFSCYASGQQAVKIYKLEGGSTGGGTTDPTEPTEPDQPTTKTYTLELTAAALGMTSNSYTTWNGDHKVKAEAEDKSTYEVTITSNQVAKEVNGNSTKMQWQKNAGSLQNKTDLGKIKSITINGASGGTFTVYGGTSEGPSTPVSGSGTYNFTDGNGFFKIAVGSSAGYVQSITIVFEK